MINIPFHAPYIARKEIQYLRESIHSGAIGGNGPFTEKCHDFFEKRYGFKKVLLTSSCTDALEMTALLTGIQPGDEVILPSYTFVSTANAFILRGAIPVFSDSLPDNPNMDPGHVEKLITPKTKVIVVVHYGGVACDMDRIMEISKRNNLFVIEDAAHAIDSFYKNRPLGSIGHLGAFSFHVTKNISSGEGGMLVINDPRLISRAEIIWEKGTNRSAFIRREVNKYSWMDIGSSFLPSELQAAVLFSQIEQLDDIQKKRKKIWGNYFNGLLNLEKQKKTGLPAVPGYATVNGHLFYLVLHSRHERDALITFLKKSGIQSSFHYIPLHTSPFFKKNYPPIQLLNCEKFGNRLLRLPFFYSLKERNIRFIINKIKSYFNACDS